MNTKRNDGDNRGYTLDALAQWLERNAEANDYRQANAKKRRAFMAGALRIDDVLKNDNGKDCESSLLSDGGRGAAAILEVVDGGRVGGESAAWLAEFRRAVATLGEVEQRIVAALMRDARPQVAARIAGTNRQRVYRTIAKLRTALKPAHEMWKARYSSN